MSTADAFNEEELEGELTERTQAAYDSVREQLNRTAARYTEGFEKMKKKLERPRKKEDAR